MWNDIGNHGQIKGKIDDWAWHYNLEFKCGQTCHRRHGTSGDPPVPHPPSFSSPRSLTLFSSNDQRQSQGVPFEGTLVYDWKHVYSSHDARKMVCNDNANMTGRLLVGSFTFECRIMHYVLCRILLPRSTNLTQASKEDLILLWALQTGCQIDCAHLVRYRMHKALRVNALLPYPHLVTLFLQHFNIPSEDEPFVKVKRSFAIGVGTVTSFGYQKDMDGQWVFLTELRDLRAFVGDRFDTMDSRITHLEDNMSFIRRCFDPPADS
ncbi:hypothetical protein GmHk_07G020491 [Glycine max]|nr:hypothetical protein GmHk_07G020491 [Glycine max]